MKDNVISFCDYRQKRIEKQSQNSNLDWVEIFNSDASFTTETFTLNITDPDGKLIFSCDFDDETL